MMTIITPDLLEWLLADPLVSSSWRSMASTLSLSEFIPSLEVPRRGRSSDSQRLKELLIIWRSVRPGAYTVETLLHMLNILGMKDMYEWMLLMTKDRLSPGSVISRLNTSRCSSQTEVRSDRTRRRRRSITPHPQSFFYSSPWQSRGTNRYTTPSHSRDLSVLSDDLDSCLNYSRSSTSPARYSRSNDRFSPYAIQTSTPVPQDSTRHRSDLVSSPLCGDKQSTQVYITPNRDTQVYRTPDREAQVYRIPDRETQVYGTPDRDIQVYRTPDRDIQVYMTSEREPQVYRTPDRDTQVYRTPGRETQVYRTPGRDTQVYSTPSRDTKVKKTPDSDTQIYSTPGRNKKAYTTSGSNRQAISPSGRETQVGGDKHCIKTHCRDTQSIVQDHGVFRTLYYPEKMKKRNKYNTVKIETSRSEVITNRSNSKNPFKEAFSEPDEKLAFQTEKYFDNLVALIEEAAKDCIFDKENYKGMQL